MNPAVNSLTSNALRPRVSIGMPIYNGARFLPAALDAILAQTFSDFEVIISDNASTDETAAICGTYAARDARIVYRREPVNRGAAWNFNRVFQEARAPYFKWAAADDLLAPTFLSRCIEVLEKDSTVVCCHSRTQKIDDRSAALLDTDDPTDGGLPSSFFAQSGPHRRHRPDASSPVPHRRFRDVLLSSGWSVRAYGVIRREHLERTSLIQPYYGYEKVTMAELALRGRFHDVLETLFFQRVHVQASSQLATAAAQQRFFTAHARPRASARWPLLQGYLRAVRRAPIDHFQRLCCRCWIMRYLVQLSKWPAVLKGALLGRGVANSGKAARRRPKATPVLVNGDSRTIVHQEP